MFDIRERGCLSNAELERLAHELFAVLPVTTGSKVTDVDIQHTVHLLRAVYDSGRGRGHYERASE